MAKRLTAQQVTQMFVARGVPRKVAAELGQIAIRESGGRPGINNAGLNKDGSVDHGLLQINDLWRNDPDIKRIGWQNRYNPEANVEMAKVVLRKQGLAAWATYKGGGGGPLKGIKSSPVRSSPSTSSLQSPDTGDTRKQLALSLLGMGSDTGSGTDELLSLALQARAARNSSVASTPQKPAGGRTGGQIGAGDGSIVGIGKLAQRMGLRVGEHPAFDKVDPVHTQGSYHYSNKSGTGGDAIDVSGNPAAMAKFARVVARRYGRNLAELIWRGQGAQTIKHGKRVGSNFYTGHQDHVHVSDPT